MVSATRDCIPATIWRRATVGSLLTLTRRHHLLWASSPLSIPAGHPSLLT